MNLENLRKLYFHELKDLYSVETKLDSFLEDMASKASDSDLSDALLQHRDETKSQRKRIEKIMSKYDYAPGGHACKGIEGILSEANEILEHAANKETIDAAIISICGRVEHYELAGYGTARAYAEQLGEYDDADLLLQSIGEESAADLKLSTLAWRKINPKADGLSAA